MSANLFLLLSLIFSLLQGSFLPPVLVEGAIVLLVVLAAPPRQAFLALFAGGIIFDLVQSQTLGLTSLVFLLSGVAILAMRDQLPLQKPIVAGVVAALVTLVRAKVVFASFLFAPSVVVGLLTILIFLFVWQPLSSSRIRLQ